MSTRTRSLPLENAIPLLLARAGARLGNALARVVRPYGLSATEWRVCASLLHTPDQALSELAVHAATDISALSRIVDRLNERRLVRRRRSTDDKRSVLVCLSAKGVALARSIVPLAQHVEAVALADFDAGEIRVLRGLLQRLGPDAPPAA